MAIQPSDKKGSKPRSQAQDARERVAHERTLIQKSMVRWKAMDEVARQLGRGLGRRELVDRVASEVGLSLKQVHSALREDSLE